MTSTATVFARRYRIALAPRLSRSFVECTSRLIAALSQMTSLRFRAFFDRWLTVHLPGSVAESTEDGYVDTVRLHLIPALGRKRLVKLTV